MTSGGYTCEEALRLQGPEPKSQTQAEFDRTQASLKDLLSIANMDGDAEFARDIEYAIKRHAELMKVTP